MLIREFSVELSLNYPLDQEYDLDKILFFDIETTGFAAETTYLYLIGCIYYKDSSFRMIQWFSEDIKEEAQIIALFFEFIKDYNLLVHYNGTGFDIPYLIKKCNLHQLPYSFGNLDSLDLYKKISPIKKMFKLDNLKQKSIEGFLQVRREDVADGGDLIQVYQSYLGKKHIETLRKSRKPEFVIETISEADELLCLLLLHNEDDLKGLVQICPILFYADLLDKPFHILQAALEGNQLAIRFEFSFSLPIRISYGNEVIHFTAYDKSALITVRTYEGEMKYFYDNYKDYYYLPAEDSAVHKSLALFVDKDYRQRAKPSNCYTRKQGIFAPQYAPIINPGFKHQFQDKLSFVEIHTDFLLQEENLEIYVSHLLQYLLSGKA